MPSVVLALATGAEEMEAVIAVDVLRRARWNVTVAAIGGDLTVTASRGVRLTADILWSGLGGFDRFDGIVIPGGAGGVQELRTCDAVLDALRLFDRSGKYVCAICAGPLVLQAAGILGGRRFTCYPGVEKEIRGGVHTAERVVRDGNLITSQGPGTAFEFALALIAAAEGDAAAAAVRRQLLLLA